MRGRIDPKVTGTDRYRVMLESLPQIVWTLDADGRCDYLSPQWKEYTGQDAAEDGDAARDGAGWVGHVHPDECAEIRERLQLSVRTGEAFEAECRLKGADGRYLWFRASAVPVRDSAVPVGDSKDARKAAAWIGACTEIEGYKQATASIKSLNNKLEERRARLQGALDAATQVSIIATDTKGIIRIFNSGAERMLQYRAAEMEGVRTPEIIHDGAECAARSQLLSSQFGQPVEGFNAIFESARRGNAEEREWTYVRKDGTRLDVNLAVTAVCGPEGTFEGFLCIAKDLTARKALEREFQRSNERLLAQTRSAEEANLAKSDFLATMSHEIRTPLNAVLGMADLLWESQLDAEQIQYVDVIRHAGANLLLLINDILDLSKIEAGHLELERIEFHLGKVLEEAVELVSLRARAKGLGLKCHFSQDVPTLLVGDPNRLRQILVNILGNAVKFTNSGATELTVRNHESGRPGYIEFLISDTGIGIPADKLETIFDDFTQADASTTRRYGGSGLGLGISRRLVEAMNGRLTVTSSVGKGSTFRFHAQFEPAPVGAAEPPREIEEFRGQRILVIDGNATSRQSLGETAGAWGLESELFGELEEALTSLAGVMAGERPYALVLLDGGIGDREGFEAARRIRQLASRLPIVLLTRDVPAWEVRRREAGLAGVAVKPVQPDELLRLLREVVKSREVAQTAPPADAGEPAGSIEEPFRILLVEDSADNRLLVKAYLKGTGHRLDIAEDGKAAVDRFQAEDFDLILMDMQMPAMDGLTATRAIRSIERQRGSAGVPIIALTANARALDIEMSHQAGCNVHLSKPISKVKLFQVIEEYRIREVREIIGIEMQSGLEEITPAYLAGRREEVPELIALLATSDFKRISHLAHRIKGTGTSYGFVDLSRIGAELEAAAERKDSSATGAQLGQLTYYLEHVQLIASERLPAADQDSILWH